MTADLQRTCGNIFGVRVGLFWEFLNGAASTAAYFHKSDHDMAWRDLALSGMSLCSAQQL